MIKLWELNNGSISPLSTTKVDLEKELELWIEQDPGMVQSGLKIVGKQLELEGGRLDILGVDPQGRWVVVEIKKGMLRREVVAQALDYASCIGTMEGDDLKELCKDYLNEKSLDLLQILGERDAETTVEGNQRDITMIIVGTARQVGLERMVQFLGSRFSVPISVVVFDVYNSSSGSMILAREVAEVDDTTTESKKSNKGDIDEVIRGFGEPALEKLLTTFVASASNLDLHVRPWKRCIMFTSPKNKITTLFTIWTKKKEGKVSLWVGNKIFSEYYPIDPDRVVSELGPEGYRQLTTDEVANFLNTVSLLLTPIVPGGDET